MICRFYWSVITFQNNLSFINTVSVHLHQACFQFHCVASHECSCLHYSGCLKSWSTHRLILTTCWFKSFFHLWQTLFHHFLTEVITSNQMSIFSWQNTKWCHQTACLVRQSQLHQQLKCESSGQDRSAAVSASLTGTRLSPLGCDPLPASVCVSVWSRLSVWVCSHRQSAPGGGGAARHNRKWGDVCTV